MNPSKTLVDLLDELDRIQSDPMDDAMNLKTVEFAGLRRETVEFEGLRRQNSLAILKYTNGHPFEVRIVHRGKLLEVDYQRGFFRLVPFVEASKITASV